MVHVCVPTGYCQLAGKEIDICDVINQLKCLGEDCAVWTSLSVPGALGTRLLQLSKVKKPLPPKNEE